jgi:phosphoribosylformimino-5-aminoimidazole carboxamide ribotide isomerase
MTGLLIYPAIDLAGGRAVRLLRGERERCREVASDPVALARRLSREGAPFLHLVDLDAAFGDGSNEAMVTRIIGAVDCPVQVGGGVRDVATAARLRAAGARRVVLGTAALASPELLAGLVSDDPESVVVAADTRSGRVVVRGWTEDTGMSLGTFARVMRGCGVRHLLVTAVERDGTGEGPSLDVLGEAVDAFGPGVIASGGIGGVQHLERLEPLVRRGLAGVVVGSLLVDGKATVRELLDVTRGF